nr:replication protein A 70 kDa DNA-binding subunit D-like [Ipomoea batatas]
MYVLATDISPMNTRSALRLCVVKVYDIPERNASTIMKSKEIVFHDQQGTFLHGHIPKEHVTRFQNVFREGVVYGLKFFLVITNFYTFKTSPYRYMIKFNYQTVVKELKNPNFPMHMYRIRSLSDIKSMQGVDEKQLFDVIGRVVELHAPQAKVINGKDSRLIDFIIEDAEGVRITCTVWDDHVAKIEPFYNTSTEEPLVDKNGIPKDIHALVGLNLIFRIVVRKEQFQNYHNAFPDFDEVNEAESPLQRVAPQHDRDLSGDAAVKRSLLDEFSSTQSSKKTKEFVPKIECVKEL